MTAWSVTFLDLSEPPSQFILIYILLYDHNQQVHKTLTGEEIFTSVLSHSSLLGFHTVNLNLQFKMVFILSYVIYRVKIFLFAASYFCIHEKDFIV